VRGIGYGGICRPNISVKKLTLNYGRIDKMKTLGTPKRKPRRRPGKRALWVNFFFRISSTLVNMFHDLQCSRPGGFPCGHTSILINPRGRPGRGAGKSQLMVFSFSPSHNPNTLTSAKINLTTLLLALNQVTIRGIPQLKEVSSLYRFFFPQARPLRKEYSLPGRRERFQVGCEYEISL